MLIGTKSQHRAQDIIFEIHDKGKDLDPEIQAVVRKVTLLRRITDEFPNVIDTCVEISRNIKNSSKKER